MRTIFLTGASRGLGRAIGEAALTAGHRVVLTARDPGPLAGLAAEHPRRALALPLDVTDAGAARRAVEAAVDRFGVPDVVVTDAGRADTAAGEDTGLDELRAEVETGLWGVVHVVEAALPLMRAARRGHFVQLSPVSGRVPQAPGPGGYATGACAAEGFLEALAQEVAGFGIKVTIVVCADGTAAGTEPARAARFVLEVTDLHEPPLRLPLGGAAFARVRAAEERRAAELAKWEHFSRSAD